jgi:hypothetical protein
MYVSDARLFERCEFRQRSCPRCHGSGYIEVYRHVEGGICFLCRGSGEHSSSDGSFSITALKADTKIDTARWFLGYISDHDDKPRQIFRFTAETLAAGKMRAERELAALGYSITSKPDGYYLIIGGIDETKKEVLARYSDYLQGK